MKHSIRITAILLITFFLAQLIGLGIIYQYIDIPQSAEQGATIINEDVYENANLEPPPVVDQTNSFIYIFIAIMIGTALILLIVRFRQRRLWQFWFYLSVVICLIAAFSPFMVMLLVATPLYPYTYLLTLGLVLVLGYFKVFRHNVYVHNFTELFMYGGIVAIILPWLTMTAVVLLLLLISVYDIIAVFKSKHMVTMAQFQSESNVFAGLLIPYKRPHKGDGPTRKVKVKTAVLGGGDVAFPLLFNGVVLKTTGLFLPSLLIAITTTIALAALFYMAEKDKFYPAMPAVTVGCFVGYALQFLLTI